MVFGLFLFMSQILSRVLNEFKPLPNDVILTSFPKTGITWLKSLLFSIIHRSSNNESYSLINQHPHDLVPTLEFQGFPPNNSSDPTRRRIFGTHIPYQLLGKTLYNSSNNNNLCQVVYITRNPKDTLISLWHFINKTKGAKESGL